VSRKKESTGKFVPAKNILSPRAHENKAGKRIHPDSVMMIHDCLRSDFKTKVKMSCMVYETEFDAICLLTAVI
jgi:hypothetical protein